EQRIERDLGVRNDRQDGIAAAADEEPRRLVARGARQDGEHRRHHAGAPLQRADRQSTEQHGAAERDEAEGHISVWAGAGGHAPESKALASGEGAMGAENPAVSASRRGTERATPAPVCQDRHTADAAATAGAPTARPSA